MNLLEDEGGELVASIITTTTSLLETNVASGQRHQDIDLLAGVCGVLSRGLGEGDVSVVLCRVDVHAMRLRLAQFHGAIDIRRTGTVALAVEPVAEVD